MEEGPSLRDSFLREEQPQKQYRHHQKPHRQAHEDSDRSRPDFTFGREEGNNFSSPVFDDFDRMHREMEAMINLITGGSDDTSSSFFGFPAIFESHPHDVPGERATS